ncbi:MAG: hypothetical protein ISR95_02475 [Candidatus Marinimicrobia bacterium]|nr:hypothetical protein [candidate division KSB1 bacterium]MBL7046489.1 hypothetical protein [Candidatus Neomarinimicrobiota bacterium]
MTGFDSLLDYIKSFPKDTLIREVWHRHSATDIGKRIIHTDYPDKAARYLNFSQGIPPQNNNGKDYILKWLPIPSDEKTMEGYAKVFSHYNCYTTLNYYSYEYAVEKAKLITEEEKLKRMKSMPYTFSFDRILAQSDLTFNIQKNIPKKCFIDLAFDFDIGKNKMIKTIDQAIPQVLKLINYFKQKNTPYSLFFSGGRGFHVVVPFSSFNQKMADNNHLINRHIAELIDFEIGPLHVDYAIYSSRRQFRMVNTYHQSSGLKKVALKVSDLQQGEARIIEIARS